MSFTSFLLLLVIKSCWGADLNVGTTLFTKADTYRECWSSESLALLASRMILEDLLPSTSILVIDSNDFVTDLVEYFRLILETVRETTHGKTKHITLVALTDLLGGYLHHAVLPTAKFAYYAGLIDYDSMATLLVLFDELKWFLRTNGQGWARPLPQSLENFEIQRIPLQSAADKDVCENLIFIEQENSEVKQPHCDVTIPMPFFDSKTRPSAIALPTKTCPVHNIEANSSNYLVMKFVVTSIKCMQLKNAKSENVAKFVSDLGSWIDGQIIPRLEDERFYSAFGGILRARNTLKRLAVTQTNFFKQDEDLHRLTEDSQKDVYAKKIVNEGHQMSRSSMILMAVLITIFVWFFLGTMFICYKMRQSKLEATSPEGGDENTTHSTLGSSKYFYPERLKFSRSKKKASSPESDDLSDLDRSSHQRRHRQQITIKTCQCHDDEEDEETTTAVIESMHTEGRLPSITEISEQSTSTPIKGKSPTGSSTAVSNRSNKLQRQSYMETDTETTEETSEPG